MSKIYNIFISHAWHRSEHYFKVVDWLNQSNIEWKNYSIPEHDPLDANSDRKLREKITRQISSVSIVIIFAGMYVNHSQWIDYEIDEATRLGKYIVSVEPWGQERIPIKIQQSAHETVGWNSASVLNAIKRV